MTKLSYFTSSFGFGNSLNLTVLIRHFSNLLASYWAASISIMESPRAIRFFMLPSSISAEVSKKALIFHLGTSPGNLASYLALAEMIVIFYSSGTHFGKNLSHEYSTQPSAALVIMKVLP
jgi:hypothetical protein